MIKDYENVHEKMKAFKVSEIDVLEEGEYKFYFNTGQFQMVNIEGDFDCLEVFVNLNLKIDVEEGEYAAVNFQTVLFLNEKTELMDDIIAGINLPSSEDQKNKAIEKLKEIEKIIGVEFCLKDMFSFDFQRQKKYMKAMPKC